MWFTHAGIWFFLGPTENPLIRFITDTASYRCCYPKHDLVTLEFRDVMMTSVLCDSVILFVQGFGCIIIDETKLNPKDPLPVKALHPISQVLWGLDPGGKATSIMHQVNVCPSNALWINLPGKSKHMSMRILFPSAEEDKSGKKIPGIHTPNESSTENVPSGNLT